MVKENSCILQMEKKKAEAGGYNPQLITNPYDWKQHPDLNITLIKSVKSVKKQLLNIINTLFINVANEPFAYPSSSDPIWIATKKTSKRKILGICMISKKSPKEHFNNEDDHTNVPYLYNFAIDIGNINDKELKASVSLMMRLKIDLMQNEGIWKWLNPEDPCKPAHINLDVLVEDEHAKNFYKKNGFKEDKIFRVYDGNDEIKFRTLSFNF